MSANQAEPQISGNNGLRIPLDHSETEALAKRIFHLGTRNLSDEERGLLIKKGGELRQADYKLARLLCGRPLPATEFRPLFFDDHKRPASGLCGEPAILVMTGWVVRLSEYVVKLERKYGVVSPAAPEYDYI